MRKEAESRGLKIDTFATSKDIFYFVIGILTGIFMFWKQSY